MRIEELHDSQFVESCIVMEHAGSIAEVFAEQTAQRLVEYIVVDHIEDIVVVEHTERIVVEAYAAHIVVVVDAGHVGHIVVEAYAAHIVERAEHIVVEHVGHTAKKLSEYIAEELVGHIVVVYDAGQHDVVVEGNEELDAVGGQNERN